MVDNMEKNQTRTSRSSGAGRLSFACLCLAGAGLLWSGSQGVAQEVQLAQATNPFPALQAGLPTSPAVEDEFAIYDPLRLKGWTIPLPAPPDTIDPNPLGIREALANLGIGYFGFSNDSFQDNLVRHALPVPGVRGRQNQLYNGQLPTYLSINYAYLTYDLRRFGIPDGQIVVGGEFLRSNWTPLGANSIGISELTYYQTLFHGLIEAKVGYNVNSIEFLGTFVGGSLAGGVFGPNGSIITEAGENTTVYPTPGINLTIHPRKYYYDKIGVSRALSPGGVVTEHVQNNYGLHFDVPAAGVWVINEAGYRRNAAPSAPQTWIRAAGSYTSSNYTNFAKPGLTSDHDYAAYFLADRQLWQKAPGSARTAAQGIYAGFSAYYTPPNLNRFTQYYEARLYGFGLIPGRPRDQANFVFTDNVFSNYLVDAAQRAGGLAHHDSKAVTVSYSAHVLPGVNLNGGFSAVNNPTSVTYTNRTGSAFNVLLGSVIFF